jgi:hypothetical protein
MFGKAEHPSRSYVEFVKLMWMLLPKGAGFRTLPARSEISNSTRNTKERIVGSI